MNSNQDILDSQLRYKILLLGFSKQVAEQVIAYLKETEPEIRALLIKQFGAGGQRLITRLRETEPRLREIRSRAWRKGSDFAHLELEEMVKREHEAHTRIFGEELPQPVKKDRAALVASTLIAGHTLGEWFTSMEANDANRAVAQLRIGVLADETVTKLSRRLTGKLSLIAPSAYNAIRAVSATGILAVSNRIQQAATEGLFDYELWVSILDSRTTPECYRLNGEIFLIGVGPMPGFHLHCRSQRVPYLPENGKPITPTYGQWIANQSRDFQDYAGKEFSYANLKPLSLDQVHDIKYSS